MICPRHRCHVSALPLRFASLTLRLGTMLLVLSTAAAAQSTQLPSPLQPVLPGAGPAGKLVAARETELNAASMVEAKGRLDDSQVVRTEAVSGTPFLPPLGEDYFNERTRDALHLMLPQVMGNLSTLRLESPGHQLALVGPVPTVHGTPAPGDFRRLPQEPGTIQDSQVQPAGFLQEQEKAPADSAKQDPAGNNQEPPKQDVDAGGDLASLKGRIDTRRTQLQDNESLDATVKSDGITQLNRAAEFIQQAEKNQSYLDTESKARKAADEQLKALQDELNKTPEPDMPDGNRPLEELNSALQNEEMNLTTAQTELRDIKARISEIEDRNTQLPKLKKTNEEQLRETRKRLAELESKPDDLAKSLLQLELESKLKALELEAERLALESVRNEQLGRSLPLRRDLKSREVKRRESKIETLRKLIDEKRKAEIKRQQEEAAAAMEANNPLLRDLAKQNQNLANQRSELTSKLKNLDAELERMRSQNKSIETSREDLRRLIDTIGLKATTGMRLVEHRRSLVSPAQSQSRKAEIEGNLRDLRSKMMQLENEKESISTSDEFVEDLVDSQEVGDPAQRDDVVEKTKSLLEKQSQYVDDLMNDYKSYLTKLTEVEAEHDTLISNIEDSKEFVNENALWVRSTNPMAFADLQKSSRGLQAFLGRGAWSGMVDFVGKHLKSRPYEAGLLLLILGGLFVVQRRLKKSDV